MFKKSRKLFTLERFIKIYNNIPIAATHTIEEISLIRWTKTTMENGGFCGMA